MNSTNKNIIRSYESKINKLHSKINNKFYRYFIGEDNLYDDLCDTYDLLLKFCISKSLYDNYYCAVMDYNCVLETRYGHTNNPTFKKTQMNNIKSLLDINIYEKLNKQHLCNEKNIKYTDSTYYTLIDNYVKYADETGDYDIYISTVDKVVKLYLSNIIKYNCNIARYLDRYYNLKGQYHKKHADILCILKQYSHAIPIYQAYIDDNITNSTFKFLVSSYIYKMMLCYMMCGDDIATTKKIYEIKTAYPILEHNHEYKYIIRITDAYLKNDVDEFTKVLIDQDEIHKLDDEKVNLLVEIKRKLSANEIC